MSRATRATDKRALRSRVHHLYILLAKIALWCRLLLVVDGGSSLAERLLEGTLHGLDLGVLHQQFLLVRLAAVGQARGEVDRELRAPT